MKDRRFWSNLCVYQETTILDLIELIEDFREEARQAGNKMSVKVMDELYDKCSLLLLQNSVLHHYASSREFKPVSVSSLETSALTDQ